MLGMLYRSALNSRVLLVILCRTGVTSWKMDKLETIDGKSCKLLTMYRVFLAVREMLIGYIFHGKLELKAL